MPHRDPPTASYPRRLLGAVAVILLAVVLVVIFGPRANPDGEWYRRTGVEGPVLIVDNIEVVPDAPPDELSQEELDRLAATTQGVKPVLTDRILAPNPDPLPLDQRDGPANPTNTRVDRDSDSNSRRDDPTSRVRRSRAAQQTLDFVLLQSVNPTYPAQAGAAMRQRKIVVSVAMYVDDTGHVSEAYIRANNGSQYFADAVLTAVRKWIYKPLLVDGEPSGFWDQINFVFTTPNGAATGSDAPASEGKR